MDLDQLNPKSHPLSDTLQENLLDLCDKLNALEKHCPWEFYPTPGCSGYRTEEEQKRINPKAMRSSHIFGCAVDIDDYEGLIFEWCQDNIQLLVKFGIWLENPSADPDGHLHMQSIPPKSGNRIYWP